MSRTALVVALVLFGILSAEALWQHGYLGIWHAGFESLAAMQVLADLVIASLLIMVWIWHDAKARGRNAWPWLAATVVLGSFAPLVYLLTRKPGNA